MYISVSPLSPTRLNEDGRAATFKRALENDKSEGIPIYFTCETMGVCDQRLTDAAGVLRAVKIIYHKHCIMMGCNLRLVGAINSRPERV